MNTYMRPHGKRPERGFTLLEVMIAVLILSIGLLGLAGLQMSGLRYNQSAYLRSQATVLAYDIIDRMRANRETNYGSFNSGTLPADPGCITSGCTSAQMASHDKREWATALAAALPAPSGGATAGQVDEAAGVFTVTVRWGEMRSNSEGGGIGNNSVSLTIRLSTT